MTTTEIITLIVTIIGIASFATVVTILFRSYIRSAIKEVQIGQRDIEIVDLMLYEKDPQVAKQRKATEGLKNALFFGFMAILIPIFGLSLYSRIKNNVTKMGNNYVLVVASGSMSYKNESNQYLTNYNNQFNTYDIITLYGVKSSNQLHQYDVVAYRNNKNIIVIHRIIGFEVDDNGELRYVTRGDSNVASDSYKPKYSDVIGKYSGKRIPGLGVFVMFFQSYAGLVTIASIVYCSFMVSHFNKKLEKETEKRREILEHSFDMEEMGTNEAEYMTAKQESVVFFKNYAYQFNEKGYAGKREMTPEEIEQHEEELKAREEESKKAEDEVQPTEETPAEEVKDEKEEEK